MQNLTIPIITLNWNGLEDTIEYVNSLLKQTYEDWILYLVDNGSEGNDVKTLRQKYGDEKRIKIIENNKNLGFRAGNNEILKQILSEDKYKYVILLNNDIETDPQFIENIVKSAEENKADVVGAKMVNYFNRLIMDTAGHQMLNTGEILPIGSLEKIEKYEKLFEPFGSCAGAVLYSTQMLIEIGVFDDYFITGYEDAEFGIRAVIAGFRNIFEPSAIVYHKVSVSIEKIRSYDYALKSQNNISYTYLKLMPLSVIFINFPFILLKYIGITLMGLLFLRFTLLKITYHSLYLTLFRDWGMIMKSRKEAKKYRKISSLKILLRQKFFLVTYFRYFVNYILKGKKTVLERV